MYAFTLNHSDFELVLSILDLGIIERNRRLLYRFLPLPIYDLFEFFTIQVHFEACQPYHVRVEITEYPVVIQFLFFCFFSLISRLI